MSEVHGGVEDYSDISGDMVTKYLETYAEKLRLPERCRFNPQVVRIERDADLGPWKLITRSSTNPNAELEELRRTKLIVSTGHECVPNFPSDLDTRKFTGTVFHAKEIGKRHDEIIKDENIKNITVVGGNKSAFEIAANMGLAGKRVNWLIREDGGGAGMMIVDRPDGKKHGMKGMTARAVSSLSTSFYAPDKWITRFLYGGKNWFGRWFSVWFWKMAFKKDLEKFSKPGLEAIKPMSDRCVHPYSRAMRTLLLSLFGLTSGYCSFFQISTGLASWHAQNNDEAVFKLIEEGQVIKASRATITSMDGHNLQLSTGQTIPADAVIFATGWKHPTHSS